MSEPGRPALKPDPDELSLALYLPALPISAVQVTVPINVWDPPWYCGYAER